MTQAEINALGIAFFSGKTLQYFENGVWSDYPTMYCPAFLEDRWRIKPDEPKKEIWCTFKEYHGSTIQTVKGSPAYELYTLSSDWTHIPSLDREVILPEGEE